MLNPSAAYNLYYQISYTVLCIDSLALQNYASCVPPYKLLMLVDISSAIKKGKRELLFWAQSEHAPEDLKYDTRVRQLEGETR